MKSEKEQLLSFIKEALAEDVGDGDHTSLSTIPQGKSGAAKLLIKDSGVLAGVEVALEVFKVVDRDLRVSVFMNDGDAVKPGDVVLLVEGRVHSILIAERLVLNLMQRMSGIATVTNRIAKLTGSTGTRILDTRKTTPNLRFLEKMAVRIGGGVNHRIGLYDMILIKDNHVDYAGGITAALRAARRYLNQTGKNLQIEIEVRNKKELKEVIENGGADRIMLDNFSPTELSEAIRLINGRFVTEASGGITEQSILDYANTGVDFISIGALTHSVRSLDMSLKAVD